MEHNDIRHTLSDYLDGAITPQEKTEIEAHLKTCRECSDALNELQKTVEHIKTVEEIAPPAWMTQKIMVKVRTEAAEKKNLFQRFFYPLSIKLPIQAVAVVFLCVTAFSIYQSMHPTDKYAEAPMQELAANKDATPAATQELRKTDDSRLRAKQIPQAPEHKALDRKEEYKATPALRFNNQLGASAPAPGKPEEQSDSAKKEMTLEQPAAAPQPLSKAEIQDKNFAAGAAPQSKAKRAAAPAKKAGIASIADTGACLSYEPARVTLTGSIRKKDVSGRPNYEGLAKGGQGEPYWVLLLDQAICLSADKENRVNSAEQQVVSIQLILNATQYEKYSPLFIAPIAVTGTLSHAHTKDHRTPVLMNVFEIVPRSN